MMPDDLSLRDLPEPPEASYQAVRRRVVVAIRRRKRVRNAAWMVAAVAACVVLAVAGALAFRHGTATPSPPMLVRAPEVPVSVVPAKAVHNRLKPKRRSVRLLAHAPAQPLVVRMQTDDPNVVILWMVD
jgi:peptidoglycan/LPS O-acetylase OafA/YrhL